LKKNKEMQMMILVRVIPEFCDLRQTGVFGKMMKFLGVSDLKS
jgi:hypothetical protein